MRLRLCCRALKCKSIMRVGSHVGGKLFIQIRTVNEVPSRLEGMED